MIPFRNQMELVGKIVDALSHQTHPTSCNLVIPVAFEEDVVAAQVVGELALRRPDLPVAHITIDTVKSTEEYVRMLARQWNLPMPRASYTDPNLLIHDLVDNAKTPLVQIVQRFEKFLEVLDFTTLSTLRTLEQHDKVRTVTISPYAYPDLKARWDAHILTVSNYGDCHQICDEVEVSPHDDILERCDKQSIPRHIAEYILNLSGGYPHIMKQALYDWIRGGRKTKLDKVERAHVKEGITKHLVRFAEKLDPPGRTHFREIVIELGHNVDVDSKAYALQIHPWHRILLDGVKLRCGCLGQVALSTLAKAHTTEGISVARLYERAALSYRRGYFDDAECILGRLSDKASCHQDNLLILHTGIMTRLSGSNSQSPTQIQAWEEMLRSLTAASKEVNMKKERIRDYRILLERYEELSDIARAIIDAARGNPERVVDRLCALYTATSERIHIRAAMLLIYVVLRRALAMETFDIAFQSLLCMPEQTLRVWGLTINGMNFYKADAIDKDVLARAEAEYQAAFPDRQLCIPVENKQYPNIHSYAYVAHTTAHLLKKPTLADSFEQLHDDLSFMGPRNPSAHAICVWDKGSVDKFITLANRWYRALAQSMPDVLSYRDIESLVYPLPLVEENGELEYVGLNPQ